MTDNLLAGDFVKISNSQVSLFDYAGACKTVRLIEEGEIQPVARWQVSRFTGSRPEIVSRNRSHMQEVISRNRSHLDLCQKYCQEKDVV